MPLCQRRTMTPKRLAANLANAKKSTGPKTGRGKLFAQINRLNGGGHRQKKLRIAGPQKLLRRFGASSQKGRRDATPKTKGLRGSGSGFWGSRFAEQYYTFWLGRRKGGHKRSQSKPYEPTRLLSVGYEETDTNEATGINMLYTQSLTRISRPIFGKLGRSEGCSLLPIQS